MSIDSKPTNPKDEIGTTKLPMSVVPESVIAYAALAWLEGKTKYGGVNWREAGVRVSIYIDALKRHCAKYYDGGEWADPKTKVPHLASIIACAGIILDAGLAGKLTDDRPKPQAGLPDLIDQLSEVVAHLKEMHKDKHPHHYTIADAQLKSGFICQNEIGMGVYCQNELKLGERYYCGECMKARDAERRAEIELDRTGPGWA